VARDTAQLLGRAGPRAAYREERRLISSPFPCISIQDDPHTAVGARAHVRLDSRDHAALTDPLVLSRKRDTVLSIKRSRDRWPDDQGLSVMGTLRAAAGVLSLHRAGPRNTMTRMDPSSSPAQSRSAAAGAADAGSTAASCPLPVCARAESCLPGPRTGKTTRRDWRSRRLPPGRPTTGR